MATNTNTDTQTKERTRRMPPLYFIRRPPVELIDKREWDWVGGYDNLAVATRALEGNPHGSVLCWAVPLDIVDQFNLALSDLKELRSTYAVEKRKTPFWLAGRIESMLAAKKRGGL